MFHWRVKHKSQIKLFELLFYACHLLTLQWNLSEIFKLVLFCFPLKPKKKILLSHNIHNRYTHFDLNLDSFSCLALDFRYLPICLVMYTFCVQYCWVANTSLSSSRSSSAFVSALTMYFVCGVAVVSSAVVMSTYLTTNRMRFYFFRSKCIVNMSSTWGGTVYPSLWI